MSYQSLEHIETERLIIRPPKMGDAIQINQAIHRSLSALQNFMPWAQDPSLSATEKFVLTSVQNRAVGEANNLPMVVIHKADNIIISGCGFNENSDSTVPFYEIGYWLDSNYTGKGYATELTLALSRFAFEVLQAHRVQICVDVDNEKSIQVATRCGYTLEARLHHNRINCRTREPTDTLVFACFNQDQLPASEVKFVFCKTNGH